MGIRLITFHTPKNYGAVLQAFSLLRYLENFSDDVQVIDFNTSHLRAMYPLIPIPGDLKAFVKNVVMLPACIRKKRKFEKFDQFVTSYLKLTERFESADALYQKSWQGDIFVTGSDQVFHPGRIQEERRAFYLDFVPDCARRISYAGSFGVSRIPPEKCEEIRGYLNKFDAISVRENSGAEIVKNLTGRCAELVLDPVFLNGCDFWKACQRPYHRNMGAYLLYYRLLHDDQADHFAIELAVKKHLKLAVLTDDLFRNHADFMIRDAGPREFLSLLDHAEFIVTDAFHGAAFSIIYQKQFVFADRNKRTNERGISLLKMLSIENQAYVEDYEEKKQLEYGKIIPILSRKIKTSEEFLRKSILGSGR